jgi:hypothetical protein
MKTPTLAEFAKEYILIDGKKPECRDADLAWLEYVTGLIERANTQGKPIAFLKSRSGTVLGFPKKQRR